MMIMRLRYVGVKLEDVARGTVFYVKFEQESDLSICVTTRAGDESHYKDLYHFLMEWKILTIEKGHEHERYDRSDRRNTARIRNDNNSHHDRYGVGGDRDYYDYSVLRNSHRGGSIC